MRKNSDATLAELKNIVQTWVDQQGHNRCWYYPDVFEQIAAVLDIQPTKKPALPSLEEFKAGCERYQQEEFNTVDKSRGKAQNTMFRIQTTTKEENE
jgi:hypothetical protein